MKGVSSTLYTVYVSTLIGYGLWNWLLARYPMSTIVPFNLLIPVISILASATILGEPLPFWKITSCVLVILGVYINIKSTQRFNFPKVAHLKNI